MSAPISKAEYLKKYLSSSKNDEEKKFKKKKLRPVLKSKTKGGLRIVDEDVDLGKIKTGSDGEDDLLGMKEEAPQVFAVVDERPLELRVQEDYASNPKWKRVTTEDSVATTIVKPKVRQSQQGIGTQRPRHDSGSDLSPPRIASRRAARRRHDSDSDVSPPRRQPSPDSDLSPPRSRKADKARVSPKRRRKDSSSDHSPVRKRMDSDSDQSPVRKRMDSDSDQSPVRNRKKGSDSDQSPVRRQSAARADNKTRMKHLDSDRTPVRRRRDSDSDQSPVRKSRDHQAESPSRSRDSSQTSKTGTDSRMTKTLDGKKAGLQSAKLLRDETEELRRRENEAFKNLSKDITGAGAATNLRAGRRRELEQKLEKEREKEEKRKELEKIYSQWNKGVKQQEERRQKVQDDVYEMSKPLARYAGDEDLEAMLREQDREGDPMAKYMAKKKAKTQGESNRPVYKGPPPPPNRFGIRPGFRWDGVDRSNGFEKKLFERKNSSKALEEEAYKWSVSDM